MKTNKQTKTTTHERNVAEENPSNWGGGGGDYNKTAATAETLVTNHPRVQTRIKTKVVRA